MDKAKQPTEPRAGHQHAPDGACCGGNVGKAKARPEPACKDEPGAPERVAHKPAGSSGCCCS
jgi:hypothetical protein